MTTTERRLCQRCWRQTVSVGRYCSVKCSGEALAEQNRPKRNPFPYSFYSRHVPMKPTPESLARGQRWRRIEEIEEARRLLWEVTDYPDSG